MADENVTIGVKVDSADATKNLNALGKDFAESLNSVISSARALQFQLNSIGKTGASNFQKIKKQTDGLFKPLQEEAKTAAKEAFGPFQQAAKEAYEPIEKAGAEVFNPFGMAADKATDKVKDLGDETEKAQERAGKETDKTTRKTKKLGDQAKKTSSVAGVAFGGLRNQLLALGGVVASVFAARSIVSGISAVTEAASIQEDAVNALNTALVTSGEFSQEASNRLQAYAASIEETTVFGDELVLRQIALAKAYGATNEQAELVTTAAIELAAATGKSLDEATAQVSKTLGGFAGELGEVNQEIKALTPEQLRNGEAARVLIDQYSGTAASQVSTFSGALAQLGNTFGSLQEVIGATIVQNPAVIAAFNGINQILLQFTKFLTDNQSQISSLVSTLVTLAANAIPLTLKAFGNLVKVIRVFAIIQANIRDGALQFVQALLQIGLVQQVVNALVKVFKSLELAALAAFDSILSVVAKIPGIGSEVEALSEVVSDRAVSTLNSINDDVNFDELTQKVEGVRDAIGPDAVAEGFDAFISGIDATTEAAERLAESITKANDQAKEAQKGVAGAAVAASTPTTGGGAEGAAAKAGEAAGNAQGKAAAEAAGPSLIDSIQSGIASGADIFQQTVGGGFVSFIDGLIDGLQQIPVVFARAFENLDSIALTLAESFADAFQRVIARLPEFFAKAVEVFGEIGAIIIRSLPQIIDALINGFIDIAEVFLQEILPGFIRRLPQIIQAIAQNIPRLILVIARSIGPIVQALTDAIPGIIDVLAQNAGPIIEALILGLSEAAFAIVDTLILKGGIVRIAVALVKGIVQGTGSIVGGILNALRTLGARTFQALASNFSSGIKFPSVNLNPGDFFSRLRETFRLNFLDRLREILNSFNPFSGGSSGGDILGDIGSAFSLNGMAAGGTVPPGFPNDSFPARLTSGEEVVDRSTSQQLRQFLASQPSGEGGGQMVQINLQIGEQELANVIFDLNERGFRTA